MSAVDLALFSVLALLGLGPAAIVLRRFAAVSALVYGASALLCLILAGAGVAVLAGGAEVSSRVLPIGLPWLGAHWRLDALAAFFLLVVGFGGAAASVLCHWLRAA